MNTPTPLPLRHFYLYTTAGDYITAATSLEEARASCEGTYLVGREATASDLRWVRDVMRGKIPPLTTKP